MVMLNAPSSGGNDDNQRRPDCLFDVAYGGDRKLEHAGPSRSHRPRKHSARYPTHDADQNGIP